MLGLTVGCARCHDHKYDPIPARDYYRLLSTFTTTVRTDVDVDLDPELSQDARARYSAEEARLAQKLDVYERDVLPGKLEARLRRGEQAVGVGHCRAGERPLRRWGHAHETARRLAAGEREERRLRRLHLRRANEDERHHRRPAGGAVAFLPGARRARDGPATATSPSATSSSRRPPWRGGKPVAVKIVKAAGDVRAARTAGGGGHRRRRALGLGDRSTVRQGSRRRLRPRRPHRSRRRNGADLHLAVQQQRRTQHRPAPTVAEHRAVAARRCRRGRPRRGSADPRSPGSDAGRQALRRRACRADSLVSHAGRRLAAS